MYEVKGSGHLIWPSELDFGTGQCWSYPDEIPAIICMPLMTSFWTYSNISVYVSVYKAVIIIIIIIKYSFSSSAARAADPPISKVLEFNVDVTVRS